MGLDNGFIVKGINKKEVPYFLDRRMMPTGIETEDAEIIYWRKCWGLRRAVLDILHSPEEKYEYEVEVDDIPAIIRALHEFLDGEYWRDNADSIWLYEEMRETLVFDICVLYWLQDYMEEHENVKCWFYDSY